MNKYIFDDWKDLKDCNSCQNWWTNTCDGQPSKLPNQEYLSEAHTLPVCDYKPIREVTIPQEIRVAQNGLKRLWWAFGILTTITLISLFLILLKG